jgi:hypothetical protein
MLVGDLVSVDADVATVSFKHVDGSPEIFDDVPVKSLTLVLVTPVQGFNTKVVKCANFK